MAWNRPKNNGMAVSMKPLRQDCRFRPTVWGATAIIILGAAVAARWLWPSDECMNETPPPRSVQRIKEVTPAAEPKVETNVVDEVKDGRVKRRLPVRVEKVSDKIIKKYYEDGTYETVVSPYALRSGEVRKPNPFKTLLEKHLAKFAIPGDDDPILDEDFTDEEARKVLDRPLNIDMNNDDEETIYRVNAVRQFKEELRQAMDAGMSANDYLKELRKRQAREVNLMRESRRVLQDEIKKGTPATAKALMIKLNENLEKQGVRKMYLTPRMKQQLGIEEE